MKQLYIGQKLITVGSTVETFNHWQAGTVTAILTPDPKPGNTGKVYIRFPGAGYAESFTPALIGAEWREAQ